MGKNIRQNIFEFESGAVGKGVLRVVRFDGEDEISKPFRFEIDLISKDPEINMEKMLLYSASLIISNDDRSVSRRINGIISEFEQTHEGRDGWYFYRAVLVPRLWYLSRSRQNQIYQKKTVPEIIRTELKNDAHKNTGITTRDFSILMTRAYEEREYVVQYDESDLNFISRLMEHEGIFYFFKHNDHADHMVMTDNILHCPPIDMPESGSSLHYLPQSGIASGITAVRNFTCKIASIPKKVMLKDYNYRKPGLDLQATAPVDDMGCGLVSEYGNHYKTPEEGRGLAKIRAEAMRCRKKIFQGDSDCCRLYSGSLYTLSGHFREAFNTEYLVTAVRHHGVQPFQSNPGTDMGGGQTPDYRNEFICIPTAAGFRPERKTPKPKLYGIMNAHVDAALLEDRAEMDDQGRYKLIMPFDASGKVAGKATRYVRMAQPYGGRDQGFHFPLHKGAEVIWSCIDGDPDRPIITGVVPNPNHPSVITSANNTINRIKTASGTTIEMNDGRGGVTPKKNGNRTTAVGTGAPSSGPGSNRCALQSKESCLQDPGGAPFPVCFQKADSRNGEAFFADGTLRKTTDIGGRMIDARVWLSAMHEENGAEARPLFCGMGGSSMRHTRTIAPAVGGYGDLSGDGLSSMPALISHKDAGDAIFRRVENEVIDLPLPLRGSVDGDPILNDLGNQQQADHGGRASSAEKNAANDHFILAPVQVENPPADPSSASPISESDPGGANTPNAVDIWLRMRVPDLQNEPLNSLNCSYLRLGKSDLKEAVETDSQKNLKQNLSSDKLDGIFEYTSKNKSQVIKGNKETYVAGAHRITIGGSGLGLYNADYAVDTYFRKVGSRSGNDLYRETIKNHTCQDIYQWGDTETFFGGFKFDGFCGLKTSVTVGGALDLDFSAKANLGYTHNVSFNFGSNMDLRWGQQNTLDAKDHDILAKDSIQLRIKGEPQNTIDQLKKEKVKVAGQVLAALAMAGAASAGAGVAIDDNKDSGNKGESWGAGIGMGVSAGLWATLLGMGLYKNLAVDANVDTAPASIDLLKEGGGTIKLRAGKSIPPKSSIDMTPEKIDIKCAELGGSSTSIEQTPIELVLKKGQSSIELRENEIILKIGTTKLHILPSGLLLSGNMIYLDAQGPTIISGPEGVIINGIVVQTL